MKRLDLVVGPNGAGKSTFVELTLAPLLPGSAFVNADEIAKQRWPKDPTSHSYQAARVGRAVSSQQTAARRRVEAALTGDLELRELSVEEGAVFNAEIAAAIQEQLAGSNYGTLLAERGITTVALDENGDIVEHRPDGSSVSLTAKRRAPRRRKASAATTR